MRWGCRDGVGGDIQFWAGTVVNVRRARCATEGLGDAN